MHSEMGRVIKPNPENCKNCSSDSSDNLPSYHQTTIIAQKLSITGKGCCSTQEMHE